MIKHIRPILNRPFFYEFYHSLIGANYRSRGNCAATLVLHKRVRQGAGAFRNDEEEQEK